MMLVMYDMVLSETKLMRSIDTGKLRFGV